MMSDKTIPLAKRGGDRFQLHFTLIGVAEVMTGFSALLLVDFFQMFVPLVVIAGMAGICVLLLCVCQPASLKSYDVLGAVLLLAYGTGTLNSLVSLALENQSLTGDSVLSSYWLTHSLGLVVAACGFLHLFGRLDRRSNLFCPFELDRKRLDRLLILSVTSFGLYGVLVASGRIGFMAGIAADAGSEISPLASVVLALVVPVGALSFSGALVEPDRRKSIILAALALLILLSVVGLGRRLFLFSSITYIMAALLFRRPQRIFSARVVFFAIFALGTLQIASTAFYALRLASWSLNDSAGNRGIADLFPEAVRIYRNDQDDLEHKVSENVKLRTFVLEYLSEIAQKEAQREPLYGQNLTRALIVATPSVLYDSKFNNKLFTSEENLVNAQFGLRYWDGANSIFTAGVADFGAVGLIAYPLLIAFMFSMLCKFARKIGSPVAGFLVSLSICQILLAAESDLAAYFASLRTIGIILLIGCLVFPRTVEKRRETVWNNMNECADARTPRHRRNA